MFNAGDFDANTIVYIPFDSFAAATGAPAATSNFANTDVQIYKDGGTTQRSSANGITATTSFDSQTGLQMIAIDLSDNTDAGFYAVGHRYQVAVADVTIDGQTVRFWAGVFSIEIQNKVNVKSWNSLATVALPLVPTTAGRTLDVSAGGEAGVDWANVGSPTTTLNLSGTTIKTATDIATATTAIQADTDDIQTRLPAALIGGRMNSDMEAINNVVVNGDGSGTPWGP